VGGCERDSEAVLGVWLPPSADVASAAWSGRALAVGVKKKKGNI